MNELKTTTALVKSILEQREKARNDDDYLYLLVCNYIHFQTLDVKIMLPFDYVMRNRKSLKFPGFETVRRARQKIQASYPELSACEKVQEGRLEKEAEYREYAREVI